MTRLTLLLIAATGASAQEPVRTEGWRHVTHPGLVDPGIGVVALPFRGDSAADSLPLFGRPGAGAPIGYFIRQGWSYVVVWPTTLSTNVIEYAYEDAGLPFDSVSPDGAWARVIPGFTPDALPVTGWTQLDVDSLTVRPWTEELKDHNLFFRPGVTPAFHDAPDGRVAAFSVPAADNGYTLYPLEVRGAWMRVRAVTPSDYCRDPPSPRTAELWIRYLDARGRPTVWYHTRGC